MLLFVGAREPLYVYRSTDPACAPWTSGLVAAHRGGAG